MNTVSGPSNSNKAMKVVKAAMRDSHENDDIVYETPYAVTECNDRSEVEPKT